MSEVPLREHIETQIKWLDRHFEAQIKAIDVSTAKAATQIDKRLESMNEFRDALRDQAGRLMTRTESNVQHDAIEARLKSMELARAQGEGKMLMLSGIIAFLASVAVGLISYWTMK